MRNSCRDAHAFERKIKRARAKKNRDLAERLQAMRPSYRLDHLVKERYVLHPAVLHGDTQEACLSPSLEVGTLTATKLAPPSSQYAQAGFEQLLKVQKSLTESRKNLLTIENSHSISRNHTKFLK